MCPIKLRRSTGGWLTRLFIPARLRCAAALPCLLSVCLFVCFVCPRVHPTPSLLWLPISAANMSSMLHDSVQALAGDGLEHGVPLGQTGL